MLLSLERFVDRPRDAGHATKRCWMWEESELWNWAREACSEAAESSFLLADHKEGFKLLVGGSRLSNRYCPAVVGEVDGPETAVELGGDPSLPCDRGRPRGQRSGQD